MSALSVVAGDSEDVSAPARASLVPCRDDARWDDFVARSPHGSAFSRSWFVRAIESTGLAVADRWLLVEGGQAQAAALVLRRGDDVLDAPFLFSPYQSLLLADQVANAPTHRAGKKIVELTAALVEALAQRYPRLSLCLHPRFHDIRGIQWFHYGQPDMFQIELRYTGLVDLTKYADFDAYLADIRPTRRYKHRRALARGLAVETSRDVELMNALHDATFARQGIVRSGAESTLVRALTAAALASGNGEMLLLRAPSGEPASATLFVYDDRCGYYLFGGNAPEHGALSGGTFVMMETIRRAMARGAAAVDMCGVNSPERGDFKTSLGAAPVPYFHARWRPNTP